MTPADLTDDDFDRLEAGLAAATQRRARREEAAYLARKQFEERAQLELDGCIPLDQWTLINGSVMDWKLYREANAELRRVAEGQQWDPEFIRECVVRAPKIRLSPSVVFSGFGSPLPKYPSWLERKFRQLFPEAPGRRAE